MATYLYSCPNCKKEIDVMHGMNEAPEVVCEDCKVNMKKMFVPNAAIIIGETFRAGRDRVPAYVGKKLEEFKEHPERDPYRAHREKKD